MAGKKKKGAKEKDPPENVNPDAKTPYQGKLRTFGWFKCPECQRTWASAYSWANTAQKCLQCKIYVYPHRQIPPIRPEEEEGEEKEIYVSNPDKNHQQSLCQKCRALGEFCGKNSWNGRRRRSKGSRRRNRRRRAEAA